MQSKIKSLLAGDDDDDDECCACCNGYNHGSGAHPLHARVDAVVQLHGKQLTDRASTNPPSHSSRLRYLSHNGARHSSGEKQCPILV
jgi:hypothetical protein